MDVQIKNPNEVDHKVLRETNRKCPALMKEASKKQNAKRQKKMELFYIILLFALILVAVLRVTGTIAIVIWKYLF